MASRRNRRAIEAGRVALRQASAEDLPFPEASFDKVLSVHTVYFWADLVPPLREIARVLKPEGRLVLAYRSDSGMARDFPRSVYRSPDWAQVKDASAAAGLVCHEVLRRTLGPLELTFVVARPGTEREPTGL